MKACAKLSVASMLISVALAVEIQNQCEDRVFLPKVSSGIDYTQWVGITTTG